MSNSPYLSFPFATGRVVGKLPAPGKRYAALLLGALLFLGGTVRVEPCGEYHEIYLPLMVWHIVPVQGAGSTYNIEFPGSTWCYDWSREPDCGVNSVPMLWDESQVGLPIGPGEWLMGFNEPELEGQANITPAAGAELWRQVETAYPDRKLVSPSASVGCLTGMGELLHGKRLITKIGRQ